MKAIIEIPKHSRNKYEYDKLTNSLVLDRILNHSYPQNYGFIPNTLSEDGDPIDVFVVSDEPISSLTHVEIELLGIIFMEDNGVHDPKLYGRIKGDIHTFSIQEIVYFLKVYKPNVCVLGTETIDVANDTLQLAHERYYNKGIEERNCI